MTITTDLNTWWGTLRDYEESNSAKARFQQIMTEIDRELDELQGVYAAGGFNMLPLAVKNKFLWAWQQLDAVRDALKADAEFMEALNWTP